MANLQQFVIMPVGAQNIQNCPRMLISGRFEDINPLTGLWETISDFTGANALDFPTVLKTLTQAQIEALVQKWAPDVLAVKAGLFQP